MSGRSVRRRLCAAIGVAALCCFAVPAVADEPAVGGAGGLTRVGSHGEACAGGADTEAQAAALAVACDRDVEVLGARTEWDTTFAQPDGTMRLDVSTGAVRTQVTGQWADIDTSVTAGDGGFVVASPVLPMTFSDGSDGVPLATIERDGHTLSMDAPFDLTAPIIDGDQITYPGVLPGVDLVVSVHPDGTGFSEVLRVESPEAAANPALAELTFPVETSESLDVEADGGGFVAVDAAGAEVFTSPVPAMWDSGADETPVATRDRLLGASNSNDLADERTLDPRDGDTVADMPATVTDNAVTIVPDAKMLADQETAWPVYIDPGISGNRNEWTMIQSGYPDTASRYRFTPDEGVGRCSPRSSSGCSRESVFRLAWEFNGMSLVGSMAPTDVISATFRVFGTHSWSCTPTGVGVYRTYGISAGTTWNNYVHSWGSLIASASVAHKPSCGNARWIEFNVTPLAQEIASKNLSTMALGMAASDEGSMPNGWKRYGWDAGLSIEYNRAPVVTAASMANPTAPCAKGAARPVIRSATPTLRAKVTDPDGQNVQAVYGLYPYPRATGLVWSTSASMASGGTAAYVVPKGLLAHGRTYEWHSQGRDSTGRLSIGGLICEFEVDLVAPSVPPVVSPVAGQPGVYPEDAVAGGVGKGGQFAFGNGGVSDVVSYKYSFDTDALSQGVTVAAGGKAAFTPTTAGTHRLYVQSVDRAGWTSPVKVYRFNVAFPGKDGVWPLDEGAGTTAADTSGSGNHLTVAGADVWGPGMLADLADVESDRGLVFDADGENALTSGPVVATNESFTVMAMVKPSVLDGAARTALSQDGVAGSGFTLGLRTGAGCGAASGCWTFAMPGEDAAAPVASARAVDARPVDPDEWIHLTAVHDAGAKTVSLYTCNPADLDEPAPVPASVSFTSTWNAAGPLRVGDARAGESWRGGVDDVRAYRGVVDLNTIWRVCHASQ